MKKTTTIDFRYNHLVLLFLVLQVVGCAGSVPQYGAPYHSWESVWNQPFSTIWIQGKLYMGGARLSEFAGDDNPQVTLLSASRSTVAIDLSLEYLGRDPREHQNSEPEVYPFTTISCHGLEHSYLRNIGCMYNPLGMNPQRRALVRDVPDFIMVVPVGGASSWLSAPQSTMTLESMSSFHMTVQVPYTQRTEITQDQYQIYESHPERLTQGQSTTGSLDTQNKPHFYLVEEKTIPAYCRVGSRNVPTITEVLDEPSDGLWKTPAAMYLDVVTGAVFNQNVRQPSRNQPVLYRHLTEGFQEYPWRYYPGVDPTNHQPVRFLSLMIQCDTTIRPERLLQ